MSDYKNPYYAPDKLGLEMIDVEQEDLSYEFDIIAFWATQEGLIFTAQDSGCSCPSPFEDYCGVDQKEVIQKLERLEGPDHAESVLRVWNKYFGRTKVADLPVQEIRDWVSNHQKP